MSLGGLGNSPIPKGVKFGGRSSAPTRKSGGGAERTVNVGGNGRVYHDEKRSALARALNNRNVNITNINNDRGGVSYSSGSNKAATIFGALTAAAGLGYGITQMARGFGGASGVAGAAGDVGDVAGAVSSNPFISSMENAQTAADLYEAIKGAEDQATTLSNTINDSTVKQGYQDAKSGIAKKQSSVDTLESNITKQKSQITSKKNTIEGSKMKLASKKSALQRTNADYKAACDKTTQCENGVQTANNNYETALSAKVTAEQNLQTIEQQLKDPNLTPEQKTQLETQKTTATEAFNKANAKLQLAEKAKSDAAKALEDAKAAEKALLGTLKATDDAVGQAAKEIDKMETDLETLEKEQAELEESLKEAEGELKIAQEELKTMQETIDDYEAKVKEHQELTTSIAAQKKRLAKLEKQGERDAEKAGNKAKDSNYWANQHKEYADAAHGRGDKITEKMETGLQGKAEANRTAAQERINTAFESMGYDRRRAGDTFKIDGKTYTANGDSTFKTGVGTSEKTYTLDELKLEFAKERSWHTGAKLSSAMSAGATD